MLYEGDYENKKRHGQGTLYFSSGEILYQGTFAENLKSGEEKNIAKTEVSSTRGFGRETNAMEKGKSSVKKELWFIREALSPVNRMEAEPNSVKMVRNSIRAIGRRA